MQKVLTAEEMREVDRLTTEHYGIPSILLMENAAHAAARVITEKLGGKVAGKSFLILCGKGNNGGDGAALARILLQQGAWILIYLFGDIKDIKGDAKINFNILKSIHKHSNATRVLQFDEEKLGSEIFHQAVHYDVFIDAMIGTGLSNPATGVIKKVVSQLRTLKERPRVARNLENPFLVSLDLPTGLNADSNETFTEPQHRNREINVKADLTVTFTAPKLANVMSPASNFGGELVVANIGSPQELIDAAPSKLFLAEKQDAKDWLDKTRVKSDSYKKTRGTALIVAGSKNYSGAACLAANACFHSGTGMVSVGVPESVRETIAAQVSAEIITRGFDETKDGAFSASAAPEVLEATEKVNIVALGCGLTSVDESTKNFVRQVVTNRRTPLVIDADGLNALAPFDLLGSDDLPIVLTPHIGEFQRLVGCEEIKDKIEAARAFAQKHNVILVLKGERSLIAAPDGRVVINPTGNAGIARAGSGDTLTGIIAGFLAQTFAVEKPDLENTFKAVVAALYISGLAGDIAAEKFSQRLMTATDIRDCLGEAIESITN